MSNNILIIKHGALGDLIQITSSLKSIRQKYPDSKITLLTDVKFKFFSDRIIFVDEIIYENRPSFFRIDKWLTIILKIIQRRFNIVFDLQNSDRTSVYYFFMKLFSRINASVSLLTTVTSILAMCPTNDWVFELSCFALK